MNMTNNEYKTVTLTTQFGHRLEINAKVVKDIEHITLRQRLYHTDEGEHVLYVETMDSCGGRDFKFYETKEGDENEWGYDDLIDRIDHEIMTYNLSLQIVLNKLNETNGAPLRKEFGIPVE